MGYGVCLTARERSVILDVLYDYMFEYSTQENLNDPDGPRDGSIFESLISKLQLGQECSSMSCEDVASCLDTPPARERVRTIVRQGVITDRELARAIEIAISTNSVNVQNTYYEVGPTAPLPEISPLQPNYDDQLWGAISTMIDYMNRVNLDALELIEAASNRIEMVAFIAQQFPVVGDNLAAAAELSDKLLEFTQELYQAYETESVLFGLKCRLFSEFRNRETVALRDIVASIIIQGAESLTNIDLDGYDSYSNINDALIQIAQSIAGTSDSVFWFMWYLQICAYTLQNLFMNVGGWHDVYRRFEIGRRNPMSGWELCPTLAGTFEHTFNFTSNDGGWVVMNDVPQLLGTWSSGVGWVSQYGQVGSQYHNRARVKRVFPQREITYVEIEFEFTRGASSISPNAAVRVGDLIVIAQTLSNSTSQTYTLSGSLDLAANSIDFRIFPYVGTNVAASLRGALAVKRITVRGRGSNPFS